MQLTPLGNQQLGRQLAELDREIHSALKDIRRNMEELEAVSRQADGVRPGQTFSDVLKDTLDDAGGPDTSA